MFTIEQIEAAHANVKSGVDFPAYVQVLVRLGVESYDNYVIDGHAVYFGKNGFSIYSESKYSALRIASAGNPKQLARTLKIHQQGLTDYPTFCRQAAEAGVEKWTVDMQKMTCAYYDSLGQLLVVEDIPI